MSHNKHFAKTVKNENCRIWRKFTIALKFFATLSAWFILAVLLFRIFDAVAWFLTATFWIKELFIPDSISAVMRVLSLIFLWAALLMVIALLWSRYNYLRYYRHNKRKLLPLNSSASPPGWREMLWNNVDFACMDIINADSGTGGNMRAVVGKIPLKEPVGQKALGVARHLILKRPIRDRNHMVVVKAGEKLTEEDLTEICRKGYYVRFVSALSKQLETARTGEKP